VGRGERNGILMSHKTTGKTTVPHVVVLSLCGTIVFKTPTVIVRVMCDVWSNVQYDD
jgi:hypothetical protein